MGWGASGIDPAGEAVVTGAYAPGCEGGLAYAGCYAGPPSFFFARIVAKILPICDTGANKPNDKWRSLSCVFWNFC